ncbi:MAG: hypothetical protein V1703_01895, partial [Candidatus Altiarchaeota archaeon]
MVDASNIRFRSSGGRRAPVLEITLPREESYSLIPRLRDLNADNVKAVELIASKFPELFALKVRERLMDGHTRTPKGRSLIHLFKLARGSQDKRLRNVGSHIPVVVKASGDGAVGEHYTAPASEP